MPVSSMGYLYLIESFDQGVAKIGHGNDPRRRRVQLQTGNPSRLSLYCAVPAGYEVEAALQAALADYRVGLEWYRNLALLRGIFCHFEDEVASRDFDGEVPMIDLAIVKDVPGLISDHLEYVREYGAEDLEPCEDLMLQGGMLYALPTYDPATRAYVAPEYDA